MPTISQCCSKTSWRLVIDASFSMSRTPGESGTAIGMLKNRLRFLLSFRVDNGLQNSTNQHETTKSKEERTS